VTTVSLSSLVMSVFVVWVEISVVVRWEFLAVISFRQIWTFESSSLALYASVSSVEEEVLVALMALTRLLCAFSLAILAWRTNCSADWSDCWRELFFFSSDLIWWMSIPIFSCISLVRMVKVDWIFSFIISRFFEVSFEEDDDDDND